MKHIFFSIFAILLVVFANSQTILMSVDAVKMGRFKGESTRQKDSDKIEVTSYSFDILAPRDIATGPSSGKRQHHTITIQKPAGSASPQFYQALLTNEILSKVVFEFYKTNSFGEEIVFYTVTLENATISSYRQFSQTATTSSGAKFGAQTQNPLFDEIKFNCDKASALESKVR